MSLPLTINDFLDRAIAVYPNCVALVDEPDQPAGYTCPTSVEFRTELARTATGKLQKYKLREPFWTGMTRKVN